MLNQCILTKGDGKFLLVSYSMFLIIDFMFEDDIVRSFKAKVV